MIAFASISTLMSGLTTLVRKLIINGSFRLRNLPNNSKCARVWLKCHSEAFHCHLLNGVELKIHFGGLGASVCDAAADADVVLIAFAISDQTEMKLPPAVCLFGRCFMVCAALHSTPFNHWHLADTHVLIPHCDAAKYWKATRNIKSTYLLSDTAQGEEREAERG